MNRVRKLAVVTTLATFFLISVGGLVRAAGAGLGCPDWPRCFGFLIPPTRADQLPEGYDRAAFNVVQTWLEYVNRLIGVTIGILVLLTLVAAWRHARRRSEVFRPVVGAFVLVVLTGLLGGQVVKRGLDPRWVTVHFVFALLTVCCLIRATLGTFGDRLQRRPDLLDEATARRRLLARIALGAAGAQFLIGAWVRGAIDVVKKSEGAPPRERWLAEVGFTDLLHRQGALLVGVLVVLAAWRTLRATPPPIGWLARVARFNVACVGGQVLAGLVLAYLGLPPWAQVVHVSLGSWLIGGLYLQQLLYDRSPQSGFVPSVR